MLKRRLTNRITTKIRMQSPQAGDGSILAVVVGERRDHRNTNAEHGQYYRGHQPVKKPHGTGNCCGFVAILTLTFARPKA